MLPAAHACSPLRAAAALAAGAALLCGGAAAAKDANTVVFASFGDWGWSTAGANNSILVNALGSPCKSFSLAAYAAAPATYAACLDGDKKLQGALIVAGLQQVAQKAVAAAMAAKCTSAGGCDFVIGTGDNFYGACAASAHATLTPRSRC
jgi:hypothetical protein